jgi:integrase
MASEKLTAGKITRARTPGTMLGDGRNLWLRVAPGGSKSWVFRYMIFGRSREMGLGSVDDVTLEEARELARDARRLVRQGADPIEKRREQMAALDLERAKVMTFKECAERYIGAQQVAWRNSKHAAQWPATLEAYVYPAFGSLSVQAIDVALVMKALDPIWAAKPETASRVRGRIESVLDWASARGYRRGENPARWRGHLENLLPNKTKVRRVEHHAALPYAELPEFMAKLRNPKDAADVAAQALAFLILTAARTGEVIGAKWSEIDFKERLWVVPGKRMKAHKEHRVPLSAPALAILEARPEGGKGDFVFPSSRGGRRLSDMALLRALTAMGRDDLTVHGFRSTFSDWCSERTNFPAAVREMALAHTIENKVEEAYRRGDLLEKRRQLMAAWARYCAAPVITAKVVPIATASG